MIKLTILLVLGASLAVAAPQRSSRRGPAIDCVKQLDVADKCGDRVLINQGILPRTLRDVENDFCKDGMESVKCVASRRNCYQGFARQLYDIVMKNFKKFVQLECKNEQSRQGVLDTFSCVGDDEKGVIRDLLTEMTMKIQFASNQTDLDKMIPAICCVYHNSQMRARAIISNACEAKGRTINGDNFYNRILAQALSDAADLICGQKYNSLASCESNFPESITEMAKIRNIVESEHPRLNVSLVASLQSWLHVVENDL